MVASGGIQVASVLPAAAGVAWLPWVGLAAGVVVIGVDLWRASAADHQHSRRVVRSLLIRSKQMLSEDPAFRGTELVSQLESWISDLASPDVEFPDLPITNQTLITKLFQNLQALDLPPTLIEKLVDP